jgi:hypothetical protein
MDCLILEAGTDMLSLNVGTSALRKFPQERKSHLHGGVSLKSRKIQAAEITLL